MKLPTPSAPFSPVYVHGESITIETEGKVLVLPSGNPDILPLNNEYTLNSNRLTIAESPFGGLKGSGSPDYCVGTVSVLDSDGIYLTDINGQNSTKTLTAGKQVELGLMSVDTELHQITQEWMVQNTGDNSPTVIDACDSITGWSGTRCTVELDEINPQVGTGCIKLTYTDTNFFASVTTSLDLSDVDFITVYTKSPAGKTIYIYLSSAITYIHNRRYDYVGTGNWQKLVIPIRKPSATLGTLNLSAVVRIRFDLPSASEGDVVYIDHICSDFYKSATIELQTPDNLSASSLQLYTHNGTSYQLAGTYSLDGSYSAVSQTPGNFTLADGTKFDDVYGSGLGRAIFPKGSASEEVTGSTGTLTYSTNAGTSKRIGLKFDLPPDDNGRTLFDSVRLKTILTYTDDGSGNYAASFDFADSTNTSYGLQNLSKPWLALYDPAKTEIDFFLFTHRPKSLNFKRDETGQIHELKLFPGNGQIYHGRITHCNPSLDSDSNTIPDCLEASVEGSITKFLQSYGMVI